MFTKIKGTGSFLPDTVLTNEQLTTMVDTSDEWIVSRSGIRERRINRGATWRMAARAAENALENAGLEASALDMIIACTATPDYYTPSMSCLIQRAIAATGAFCMDLNAACASYVFALDCASQYIKTGRVKRALIVCADSLSYFTDYTDRTTCVLFGDGAGATVVTASEEPGVLLTHLGSEGDKAEALVARALRNKNYLDNPPDDLRPDLKEHYMYMNGRDVFRFAVGAITKTVTFLLDRVKRTAGELDWLVMHQANTRILSSAVEKLGIDAARAPMTLDKYGNTSSSSVPIMLDELRRGGRLKRGQFVALAGFGGGLTYGGALLNW